MATALKDRTLRDDESDKDSTEEELERLVFGDSAGFRENVRSFKDAAAQGKSKELVVAEHSEEEDGATGLEGLADEDLFFLDDTPGDAPVVTSSAGQDGGESSDDGAAWTDSDDERVTVSLASRTQLRKLRQTAADDVITGKEYSRRLRKHFRLLNPVPEWVHAASGAGKARKKRRTSTGSETTESSDDEMDVDEEDEGNLSAQPLARLLQDVDALTRTSQQNGAGKKRKLRPEMIDIQRMKDIVSSGPSSVTCLQVHPSLPLIISSGPSKTISIHSLQPQPPDPNPLLTTLHIKRTPLHTTLFHPSRTDARIFFSGRRRYFHVWNLSSGHVQKVTRVYGHADEQKSMERFKLSPDGAYLALLGTARKGGGVLNILDANTLQWVAQARVESLGGIADFAWWRDGKGLCIAGKNGEITEWLLSERVAVARWKDEGAVGTTTLALGGDSGRKHLGGDRWVSVGSSSGIVNIYDRRAWTPAAPAAAAVDDDNSGVPKNPKPARVLDQLVTPISHLHFSPDGQVMCMASRWKSDALRLVHLPSCTVYKNWPTGKTPLGRVSAVAFGTDVEGGLCLIVGNEQGALRGWEIRG
ncbi:uncharacterized protein PV09_03593 [Verruconis gallopava]|uniref:Uncharacterized protein n=1 Tax=Verruconis gallopava TaxID=253628 RepID=A0A0D1XSK6_9PEZI|nr:uncharacterized protein PV09_03593 [Verruconis gallopava]KIW05736.1 hypothetical protein PV09_03593 [Verruconis gallopava]